jgi:CRISPR-associated endoribonuclease Cas6
LSPSEIAGSGGVPIEGEQKGKAPPLERGRGLRGGEHDITPKMLSPMTMYSTLSRPDGKSKTYYYSPFEREFSSLMESNARKKYELVSKKAPNDLRLEVVPEKVNKGNEKIMKYKGTVIKAWTGIYHMRGSPELLRTAYECGLGAKNSQGFGMIGLL